MYFEKSNDFAVAAEKAGMDAVNVTDHPFPEDSWMANGGHHAFDPFVAADQVGPTGKVIGVDMTGEMLAKSRATAAKLGLTHVEFRDGLAEELPVEDGWADVVISNGVINLCADKQAVFAEIHRVLRPGGVLQFADIANGRPVPIEAMRDVDLWTG